jgi:hypothetical protein
MLRIALVTVGCTFSHDMVFFLDKNDMVLADRKHIMLSY